jgi:hypothetical protein
MSCARTLKLDRYIPSINALVSQQGEGKGKTWKIDLSGNILECRVINKYNNLYDNCHINDIYIIKNNYT